MSRRIFGLFPILMLLSLLNAYATSKSKDKSIVPATFSQVKVGGELQVRILKNFDRLEEKKYQPAHVFLTDEQSGHWQGDTE